MLVIDLFRLNGEKLSIAFIDDGTTCSCTISTLDGKQSMSLAQQVKKCYPVNEIVLFNRENVDNQTVTRTCVVEKLSVKRLVSKLWKINE